MDNVTWEGNVVALNKLDTAAPGGNVVEIDRIYYRLPLGDSFTIQAGPLTRNTEMMGYKASAYAKGGSKILDFFGGSLGTPGVWNKETGGGFGAIYSNKKQVEKGDPYFTVAANYVADSGEANDSNPNTGGFMTDNSEGNITTQIAYGNKQWGFAAGYRYGQCGAKFRTATEFAKGDKYGTPCTVAENGEDERTNADSHSWSFHGFWRPEDSGWMPSISAGVGASYLNGNDAWDDNTTKRAMASWMVGLTWNDVFMEGNALGYAVGQPQFVFEVDNDSNDDFVADGGYAMELWYSFQVTDNIQITPAVYWLSRPEGDNTRDDDGDYTNFGVLGGLIQTTFKF